MLYNPDVSIDGLFFEYLFVDNNNTISYWNDEYAKEKVLKHIERSLLQDVFFTAYDNEFAELFAYPELETMLKEIKINLEKSNSDKDFNYTMFDFENDIITFKFRKEFAGDLQRGDVLTNTWAWTALRFNYEPMTILFSNGELVKDAAPFIESNTDYGKDYIIQH